MTVKAGIISNDSLQPSIYARIPRYPTTPLRSFKELNFRKRTFFLLVLIAAIAGVMLVMSQIFGSSDHGKNASFKNSSNTSSSSNQQPIKEGPEQSSASSNSTSAKSSMNTSTSLNSSSTSVTVNGQSIDVPQTGSYDKTVNVSGGNVHVSGTSAQSTTGSSATNSSNTNVEINTE